MPITTWLAVRGFVRVHLRQSEIQHLRAVFRDHDVAGLEIAVNDALRVRFRQRGRYLCAVSSATSNGRGPFSRADMVSPSTQFHHQIVRPNIVERADIGVIQR